MHSLLRVGIGRGRLSSSPPYNHHHCNYFGERLEDRWPDAHPTQCVSGLSTTPYALQEVAKAAPPKGIGEEEEKTEIARGGAKLHTRVA